MNWTDLLSFVPLAIACNTTLPIPFDPVLIFFAARQSDAGGAILLASIGSICAGIASAADVALMRFVPTKASTSRWLAWMPQWTGRRLYLLAFVFALLPLPFLVVRLAILRTPPKLVPYGVAVTLGRFPRYLLTVLLLPVLGLPSHAPAILLGVVVILAVIRMRKTSPKEPSEQIDRQLA